MKRGKTFKRNYFFNATGEARTAEKDVNDADLQLTAQKQAIYLKSQAGTISGTIQDFNEKAVN